MADIPDRLQAALADRYEIERELGEGGMATVYLAKDLKHDRDVAVKVLKPELAAVIGTERFLAEIRTTANLQHPHILPLFDSGEAGGFLFYVMPFVDGESLKHKLARDGQLPVEEAIRITTHVAEALDSAHRHGVIHRDIKPGNILFHEGEPVVADFGIALAVSAAGEGRLTETGLSLGTPHYMSPEQASGDEATTAASDVYSLGCVLYEMLTGDPPHTGSSAQAILGKILLADVTRPTKLRRTIPANVEGAVLKALERLPADRFESVADLAAALRDATFRHGMGAEAATPGPWKAVALASAAVALAAMVVTAITVLSPDPPLPVTRLKLSPPGVGAGMLGWDRVFAIAPDGSSMIYADTVGLEGEWQLWVKDRGAAEGRPLSGTAEALDVVYSPDGQWIAYAVGSRLVKRPLRDGGPVTLLEGLAVPANPGGVEVTAIDWMADGTILCELDGGALVRIPESGGAQDTVFAAGTASQAAVHGLPGGTAALAVMCPGGTCGVRMYLAVVDLQRDTSWMLVEEVREAWYVDLGYVVWVRQDGAVFATPFDLRRLELTGADVPLFEGVRTSGMLASILLTRDGTLAYVEGGQATEGGREVVWVNRSGLAEPVDPGWGAGVFTHPALSPDGQRLALSITSLEGRRNIWVKELPEGPLTRLTTMDTLAYYPVWSSDGASVAYRASTGGGAQIRSIRADGSSVGAYEVLVDGYFSNEVAFTPDGRGLVFRYGNAAAGMDIGFKDLSADTVNPELLATEFNEKGMVLSPDGRWLAFVSDASGRNEVFVRPFPDVASGLWPVSRDGGTEPLWSPAGAELFYRRGDGWMVAATYEADSAFTVLGREALFDAGPYRAAVNHRDYDVSASGERFIMLAPYEPGDAAAEVILVQNWFTELEEVLGRRR